MTRLTKEEREFLSWWKKREPEHFTHAIIDRLSARCEELSRVVEQDINPTPTDKEVVELNANLSALLSAVEPIVGATAKAIERDERDAQRADESNVDRTCTAEEITFGMLRTLSTVADGIKGGKK